MGGVFCKKTWTFPFYLFGGAYAPNAPINVTADRNLYCFTAHTVLKTSQADVSGLANDRLDAPRPNVRTPS